MNSITDLIITLDVDWAPDFMIDHVAQILIDAQVKATWFVTHPSKAIDRLNSFNDLFELGIHPNPLHGSTHGNTEDEVLTYTRKLLPQASSMRTHGLYQTSNWLIKAAKKYDIKIDVSLFLPRATHLQMHQIKWYGASIWRIPYFWADDSEMFEKQPLWTPSDSLIKSPGLKVFDFHPIHIMLNTDRFEKYEYLKQIRPLALWDEEFTQTHIYHGYGPRVMFLELVEKLAGKGAQINELVDMERI